MGQSLGHGEIGIVQLHVFSHQCDPHCILRVMNGVHEFPPFFQIRLPRFEPQLRADQIGKMLFFQHERHFIQGFQRPVLNHALGADVAEQRNLVEHGLRDLFIAAGNDDVGIDSVRLQVLDGMLCGLGFVFIGTRQIGNIGHMHEYAVFTSHFQGDLPDAFQKRQTLDVTRGAADFRDDEICLRMASCLYDEILDFIRHMRDHLYGFSQIFSVPFLVDDIPVHPPGGQVRIRMEVLVDEALIMTQIQIGFQSVICHKHFPMLIG